MSANDMLLDFTSPGAIPPDPVEEARRVVNEIQTKMQALEALLENEQVKDVAGWKLLAMFYLATDRTNDLAKIEKQYKSITGSSLSAGLEQKYAKWFNRGAAINTPVVFEIPQKITAETLPDSVIIQHNDSAPYSILLDFSKVQEIDNEGLKKLAKLFFFAHSEKEQTRTQANRPLHYLFAKQGRSKYRNTSDMGCAVCLCALSE